MHIYNNIIDTPLGPQHQAAPQQRQHHEAGGAHSHHGHVRHLAHAGTWGRCVGAGVFTVNTYIYT